MPKLDPTKNQLCIIGESDPFLARLLQRFAEKSGIQTQLAQTGEDVLQLVRRNKPDLIILDPELPGKVRGWEAAQILGADRQSVHMSVIICSWLKKNEALALVGQISAFLQKPDLRYEDFSEAVKVAGLKSRVTRKKRFNEPARVGPAKPLFLEVGMNSRERVQLALNHKEADRVPLDLGGSGQTGMHVSTVYALRQALKLDPPGTPVKVIELFQMLGEIKPDLRDALDVDVISLSGRYNFFGFKNEGWKPWTTFDGTPVLVPELFNTEPDERGEILMYAQGDTSMPPCAKMPNGGYYFDSIMRQPPFDDASLNVEDNLEEFGPVPEDELEYLKTESEKLYAETDKAIVLGLGGMAYGDIALVPGPTLKNPKGIRDITEWYMSTVTRQDYIREVFERQCEIALENLPKIYAAVGNRVTVAWVSGTDFGAQNNCFISPKAFRSLYKPFYKRVNDWIHQNTTWKTFIHSCGAILPIIPDIIEAGFDILNPVQTSAANMDPTVLKTRFGDQVTFWGGGVDTQKDLPFGTPDDVRTQVRERLQIFGKGGGFVFNPIHNVQAQVPIENLLAMYETVHDYGRY